MRDATRRTLHYKAPEKTVDNLEEESPVLEYKQKTVLEVAACMCDRCKRYMTVDDLDWSEKVSLAYRGGFGSIFGDGCEICIDLCQQCVMETLGDWLRISPASSRSKPDAGHALPVLASTRIAGPRARTRARSGSGGNVMTGYRTAEARMRALAREAVFASAEWLTAAEIAERSSRSPASLNVTPHQWQREGRIFAIRQDALDYFPRYGLDPHDDYRPLTAMREVLAIFANSRDGWGLACWFASVNSYLGGQRPQDLLAAAPNRVIAAAKVEMQGIAHG